VGVLAINPAVLLLQRNGEGEDFLFCQCREISQLMSTPVFKMPRLE
jgi:hypothetical protein